MELVLVCLLPIKKLATDVTVLCIQHRVNFPIQFKFYVKVECSQEQNGMRELKSSIFSDAIVCATSYYVYTLTKKDLERLV